MMNSKPVRAIRFAASLVRDGKTVFLFRDVWTRFYKAIYEIWFALAWRATGRITPHIPQHITIQTEHPVASTSLDHLLPTGTAHDNSTNKKFVLFMHGLIKSRHSTSRPTMMDLGCSGGQLVKDFRDLGWLAVGLEGSDYSQKHARANWPSLGSVNLFTCDITKPFSVMDGGEPVRADLITAWEVLEHIPGELLPSLFENIARHLAPAGMFIATTTSEPAIMPNGVNVHQSMLSNAEWVAYIRKQLPAWKPLALPLRDHQFVRHNPERSFLLFQNDGD